MDVAAVSLATAQSQARPNATQMALSIRCPDHNPWPWPVSPHMYVKCLPTSHYTCCHHVVSTPHTILLRTTPLPLLNGGLGWTQAMNARTL
jgi:hypothetical protein